MTVKDLIIELMDYDKYSKVLLYSKLGDKQKGKELDEDMITKNYDGSVILSIEE